jgi:toxin ParE1/3/4
LKCRSCGCRWAEANLLHIIEYIAEDNVAAALSLAKLIRIRAEQLSEPPTLFRKGRVRGTREMVVHPNYVVVYRVRARLKRVEILRVATRGPAAGAQILEH